MVPVVIVLKALRDTTDREIHERLLQGQTDNTFLAAHVEVCRVPYRSPRVTRLFCVNSIFFFLEKHEPALSKEHLYLMTDLMAADAEVCNA